MNVFELAALADQYASLKAKEDLLKAQIAACKEQIKATGRDVIEGTECIVTVGLSKRSTLDAGAVKQFLTSKQIRQCTKVTTVETIRVKALNAAFEEA